MTRLTPMATREIALGQDGRVEIELPSGSLRVRGIDGDRIVVTTRSGRPVDEVLRIDAQPGLVRIRDVERGLRFGPVAIVTQSSEDLDVDVPRDARLVVRTMSGDVEAAGVRGESRWATASGDVRLGLDGGPVAIESMSGDVTLAATRPLRVSARAVSGDLRLRAPRIDELDASTTSGDVRIEAELHRDGTHRVSSVSGDVELVTPSPVALSVETLTGDLRVDGKHRMDGGRGHRAVRIADGSVPVTVRTTSGDVRLRSTATGGSTPVTGAAADARASERGPSTPAPATTPPISNPTTPEPALVAEAEAAPNLVRPEPAAARLALLRALERGELDVETAMRRLETLDGGDDRG